MMKQRTNPIYECIGSLRERFDECRFLNKQMVIDHSVNVFSRFLNSKATIDVFRILEQNYNEVYDLHENIYNALYDYFEKTPNLKTAR